MDKFYKLQSFLLFAGTTFAWFTVFSDFSRFYALYGSLTRIQNCVIPNPITTPCFYGAFAFLFAFVWSLMILRHTIEVRLKQQKRLTLFLVGGSLFAWGNFGFECLKFYLAKNGPKLSCSGIPTNNVFFTSCFYGSVIFLASLILSLGILKYSKGKINV